ncbi:glucosyltransferase [Pseudooceanicola nanhaiensis]|jgi:membrane glycosyltransferase|uniref:Glucans biosynthesis glucosyltransferase H n=1 Tax=Pseudooceanicola nanhaiensis TaxID=375761 RepID=A0A917SJ67_9RHOB|nr:glucans biosynthesis glucosyltransferase MdoH [Pseudooceanicola nanhaiensis]GGL84653.1 glucosyltransferase [Pseudooceanicola nanhaiensis]
MSARPAPTAATRRLRAIALVCAVLAAGLAAGLLAEAVILDGFDTMDLVRSSLIFVTTAWLAWGAALAFTGLPPARRRAPPEMVLPQPRSVILVPICNEDPVETFARIAAMDASVQAAGVEADFAILSDTRDALAAKRERDAFVRLLETTGGTGRIFYRRREDNRGRKAGNVEEFFRTSGAAYDLAVILDADSLMEGAAIRTMIARMQADPELGLLQTLPRIVAARSFFGRAMQFSAAFHGPVFTRGLARMQGVTGPFWGHNAIVRVRAFAQSCALPELKGRAPFGGHILSHDYVEAALLARNGWKVEVDGTIEGSYEEGPENVLAFAKRDRRWCQGNLQHARLLFAPGLAPWSRFVFLQGIFAYLVSLLWAGFLVASVVAAVTITEPDYFPDAYQLFPVFPDDRTRELTALALGIVGLLILPKFAILAEAALTGRARGFGGVFGALASVVTEIILTSILAPIMMLYQSRAVLQVLAGQDGGWPANARGEGRLTLGQSLRAGLWLTVTGVVTFGATLWFAPALAPWLLPVCLPMMLAPLIIAASSQPTGLAFFRVPEEGARPEVVAAYRAVRDRWTAPATADQGEARDVAA